ATVDHQVGEGLEELGGVHVGLGNGLGAHPAGVVLERNRGDAGVLIEREQFQSSGSAAVGEGRAIGQSYHALHLHKLLFAETIEEFVHDGEAEAAMPGEIVQRHLPLQEENLDDKVLEQVGGNSGLLRSLRCPNHGSLGCFFYHLPCPVPPDVFEVCNLAASPKRAMGRSRSELDADLYPAFAESPETEWPRNCNLLHIFRLIKSLPFRYISI